MYRSMSKEAINAQPKIPSGMHKVILGSRVMRMVSYRGGLNGDEPQLDDEEK
jgi:hypothetical protein